MNPTPHQITEACTDWHCFSHNVDEPKTGWQLCAECMHVFPTARALRRDYRRTYWRHTRDDRFGRVPLWYRLWRAATIRASRINHCPHCAHSF